MGLDWEEDFADLHELESPQRRVWLEGFDIRETPITVDEWKDFLEDTGYEWPYLQEMERESPTGNHPVCMVSWDDAVRFAAWITETTNQNISLPTEAQWERACRGTDGRPHPYGWEPYSWESSGLLAEVEEGDWKNHPVDFRKDLGSPCGCLGMWLISEWCLDFVDPDEDRDTLPPEVISPRGPATGEYRAVRGGTPFSSGSFRCSFRGYLKPNSRSIYMGFRLARDHGKQ